MHSSNHFMGFLKCSMDLHLNAPVQRACISVHLLVLAVLTLLLTSCSSEDFWVLIFFFFVRLLICNWFNGYICISVQVAAAIDMVDLQACLQSNRRHFLKRQRNNIQFLFERLEWGCGLWTDSTSLWNKSSL